jgi:alpha-glucosidase
LLLLTLRGTPTMYYGDELGMADVPVPRDRLQDPFEKNVPGIGVGRDPARTPMRWAPRHGAGFTTGEPWLPIGGELERCNVEDQARDPASMLSFYRSLLEFRRGRACLSVGDYAGLPTNECCLAYVRRCGNERLIVILNFSDSGVRIALPHEAHRGQLVLSTDPGRRPERLCGEVELGGTEGVAIEA